MYYNNIVCKDCNRILARLNQTVVVETDSNTLCYACANVRYTNIKREPVAENEMEAS